MVSKPLRIGRADFPTVLRAGKRYQGSVVTAVHVSGKTPRISVVVSKKVSKLAVDRNRLRRRVYGAVERFLKASPLTGTVIILVKPDATRVSAAALAIDVTDVLAQITKSR